MIYVRLMEYLTALNAMTYSYILTSFCAQISIFKGVFYKDGKRLTSFALYNIIKTLTFPYHSYIMYVCCEQHAIKWKLNMLFPPHRAQKDFRRIWIKSNLIVITRWVVFILPCEQLQFLVAFNDECHASDNVRGVKEKYKVGSRWVNRLTQCDRNSNSELSVDVSRHLH